MHKENNSAQNTIDYHVTFLVCLYRQGVINYGIFQNTQPHINYIFVTLSAKMFCNINFAVSRLHKFVYVSIQCVNLSSPKGYYFIIVPSRTIKSFLSLLKYKRIKLSQQLNLLDTFRKGSCLFCTVLSWSWSVYKTKQFLI